MDEEVSEDGRSGPGLPLSKACHSGRSGYLLFAGGGRKQVPRLRFAKTRNDMAKGGRGGQKSSTVGRNTELSQADPQTQLDSFLAKNDPEVEAFARRALAKMRKLVPGAVEMVYDNYNWLVIGFSPTERPSEAIFSLVLPPGRVTLCFLQGAGLPDPAKRLQGSGNVVRNIRLYNAGEPDARVLDDPEVLALINVALNRAKVPMPANARRKLIIRAIAAKQRPRRVAQDKK